jgi:hypothetical protein
MKLRAISLRNGKIRPASFGDDVFMGIAGCARAATGHAANRTAEQRDEVAPFYA